MPPVAPPSHLMEGLSPSAARPLSILRNGGGAAASAMPASAPVAAYPAPQQTPSGPVMEGLSPSAARPLSILRSNGGAAPVAPPEPPRAPAGATPLSRTTEPAPAVRITNVRRPEPPPGPPEPPPYADEDARYYPEENSPEGCASGECIPEAAAPAPAPVPEPDPEPEAAPAPVVTGGRDNPNLPLPERWRAAVEGVKAASPRHGAALANGRLVSMRAGEIVLGFLPTAGFHRTAVTSPSGKATVDKALAEHFGRAVKLTIQEVSAEDTRMGLSIAEQDAQSRAAHEKSTEGKVRNHPSVRAVLKLLGGEIEHIQVYEPERPSAVPAADTPDDSA